MTYLLKHFLQDEGGATAIEYGLIASLIAVGLIAGGGTLRDQLDDTLTGISDVLEDNTP